MAKKLLILSLAALAAVLLLAACNTAPEPAQVPPTQVPATKAPPPPEPTSPPAPTEEPLAVPFLERWKTSGHADTTAEAFVHWNEEDPAEVPESCAKCHSSGGYQDFIGADGSPAGVVDAPAKIGSTVECETCHNDVTVSMTSVTMPSGAELTGLGDESRCMQCHQGRASKQTVLDAIAKVGLTDDDTVSPDLGFTNIHYFAAAATIYGTKAQGGFEYDGKTYDARLTHVSGYNTCIQCHDSHTLEVKIEECATCHVDVSTIEDLQNVRMYGSLVDYDGDGDLDEGIAQELDGLRALLYQAIQAYANEKSELAIIYDPGSHPYWFIDSNANGTTDEGEVNGDNRFNAWTGRLAKSAYNYQLSVKDPGAYAHGGKYIIQLLYDSIEDLNTVLAEPIDLTAAHRIDDGHFAGSEEAFRHWDEEAAVPSSCAKCHSATGLPMFLTEGMTISQPQSNGLACQTCHNSLEQYTRYEVAQIKFPSGATVDSGNPNTNLCMNCHQGRESTTSVNNLIKGIEPDAKDEKLRFLNVHYFAAGATLFGTEARGAYEFEGKTYLGRLEHVDKFNDCTECHSAHELTVQVDKCATCHDGVESAENLTEIRMAETDFDGDGDVTEGLAGEIDTYREKLLAAMQAYATELAGAGIAYDAHSHPYFFKDTNGNGTADPDEVNSDNRFLDWTPRLLQAAYNYQYATKDPGGFAHNGQYLIQVLYDSLESLGQATTVDMTGLVRP